MQIHWIPAGKILKPHGLKGKLKVKLETGVNLTGQYIRLGKEKEFKVEGVTRQNNTAILSLIGLESIDQIEELIGEEIYVQNLAAGEFAVDDLLKLKILEENQETTEVQEIAEVVAVENLPAKAILRLRLLSDKKEFLLPLALVDKIDIKEGKGYISEWERFLLND